MEIFILFLGIIFVVAGLKGTETELAKQLEGDLYGQSGQSGFIVWLAALLVIGGLGYIPVLQKPSRYLLALVVLVIFLANGGVFSQLFGAIPAVEQAGPAAPVALPSVTPSAASGGASSSSSSGVSGTGVLGAIGSVASLIGGFL